MSTLLFQKLQEAPQISLPLPPTSDLTAAYVRELRLRSLLNPDSLGYSPPEVAAIQHANNIIAAKLGTGNLNSNKTQWMHRTLAQ